MTDNAEGYRVEAIPAARRLVTDAGRLDSRRHLIHGLVEFDVTGAREFIRQHKARTGESLSFTAFLAICLARAAVDHPHVNAYRNWRNQLIVFDDVDVGVMIEAEINGVAIPHVIRAANRRSYRDIHDEIRRVQTKPATSEQKSSVMARVGVYVPQFVRMLFFRLLLLSPQRLKRIAGTVMLTSVGMFAQGGGWGIGFLPLHTIGLTVGGIAQRPVLVDGQWVNREYLCITISIDHDIVDGAPAARFAQSLKERVEGCYGLSSE